MKTEPVVAAARAEVDQKTWGVTQQILSSNHVRLDASSTPIISRVAFRTDRQVYEVYLPLERQSYFLVVVIAERQDGLQIAGAYVEARTRVYLCIESDAIPPAEIVRTVGVMPTSVHSIGEPTNRGRGTFRSNQWILEPERDVPGTVEEKVTTIAKLIAPFQEAVRQLSSKCTTVLNIVYENWVGNPQFGGMNLDTATIELLAALKCEVSLDLYATGPMMDAEG